MAGSYGSQAGRGDEPPALVILIEGLIDRAQRSPLMRRTPAQCSPEEQATLASILADLSALRALRTALEGLPPLRLEQLTTYWPELGALVAGARRAGSAARARTRESQGSGGTTGGLFESPPIEGELINAPAEEANAPAPEPTEPAEPEQASTEKPEIARLLLEALTSQGRALTTTQMLAWLQERGLQASREMVMDALYRHEDLFRQRGSYWVAAGQDGA